MRCPYRFAFTLLLIQNAFAQDSDEPEESDSLESSLNAMTDAFNTAGIVPALIPSFRPSATLSIQYTMAGEPFTLEDGEKVPNACMFIVFPSLGCAVLLIQCSLSSD